jgi:hypothetical protein
MDYFRQKVECWAFLIDGAVNEGNSLIVSDRRSDQRQYDQRLWASCFR